MSQEKITFVDFDPIKGSKKEWEAYHTFRRKKNLEVNPDDPISSNDSVEKSIRANVKNPEANIHLTNIIDSEKNLQIGEIMCATITEESPSFEGTKHLVQFDIYVLKDYRRQGIGASAIKRVYEFAAEENKLVLITGTEEANGRAFLDKIGAQIALAGMENRLQLNEIDWGMIENWSSEGQRKSSETKLEIHHKIPDGIIEDYCKIYTEVMNQQPLGNLDVGAIVITSEVLRNQEKMFSDLERPWIRMITREPNGEISGLTEMRYNPNRNVLISQLMTGVQEKHRGRGLGKWLKASMLLQVRKEFPKVKTVTTGNAATNAPMLSINDRLGFKKHKETMSAQITIEQLKKYLDTE